METQMAVEETKTLRVFKIVKEINSPNKYIYDLSYAGGAKICLSVEVEDCRSGTYLLRNGDIEFVCYSGLHSFFLKTQRAFVFRNNFEKSIKMISLDSINTIREIISSHTFLDYIAHGMTECKSGHLLICMWNGKLQDKSHGKVIKFELTTGTMRGEFALDKHRSLFTFPTYITENGNTDICVSDVGEVVVIDERGVLRFRYLGLSKDSHFDPYGICADSECNIIVADMKNEKIHMIDQNGRFICFVFYENMKMPRALCIDENDNLYVSEWKNDQVKVISSQ
ncbi:uncharacterized protein LOC133176059 [Saccostrea echinata]|uniref:uncharacterized protein LOC133176059 n=1 Tax=Saccostrea echinata TaxID=191078 RepID=UPI002A7EE9DB|nr:uncharacterized protein LOC133176059 [Saccostrea echinata]